MIIPIIIAAVIDSIFAFSNLKKRIQILSNTFFIFIILEQL